MSLLSTQQLPVGTGFSRNADRPWTHHGFLHRGDARWHWGSHPRQRFSGRPQETLPKAKRVWQRVPQQVRAHSHQTRDHVPMVCTLRKDGTQRGGMGISDERASDNRRQSSTFLCDWISLYAPAGIFSSNGFLCVSWPTGPHSHTSEKAPESFHTFLKANGQNTRWLGWGGILGDLP